MDDFRDFTNASGSVFDAGETATVFAEDMNQITSAAAVNKPADVGSSVQSIPPGNNDIVRQLDIPEIGSDDKAIVEIMFRNPEAKSLWNVSVVFGSWISPNFSVSPTSLWHLYRVVIFPGVISGARFIQVFHQTPVADEWIIANMDTCDFSSPMTVDIKIKNQEVTQHTFGTSFATFKIIRGIAP
jgi:hypothetical protein